MDEMDAQIAAANEAAENGARGITPTEEGESDFMDGSDLSGPDDAPRSYAFVVRRGTREFRLSEPDGKTYNAFLKASQEAENEEEDLKIRTLELGAERRKLMKRLAAALGDEAEETPESVKALLAENARVFGEVQDEQAANLIKPMQAMRDALEYCLRGWTRKDGVPFNAKTRAALTPSRAGQLFEVCWQRKALAQNNQAFLSNC